MKEGGKEGKTKKYCEEDVQMRERDNQVNFGRPFAKVFHSSFPRETPFLLPYVTNEEAPPTAVIERGKRTGCLLFQLAVNDADAPDMQNSIEAALRSLMGGTAHSQQRYQV
eukprot:759292-Hanusia_phi.AAC.2